MENQTIQEYLNSKGLEYLHAVTVKGGKLQKNEYCILVVTSPEETAHTEAYDPVNKIYIVGIDKPTGESKGYLRKYIPPYGTVRGHYVVVYAKKKDIEGYTLLMK